MASAKTWKLGDPKAPDFSEDFEITNKAVLQVTDIKSNHNKYYAIEVHSAVVKGKERYRVFTHYGRTDDLETSPDAGQKECRYYDTLAEAQGAYESIYREKTSPRKGYKELSLASSRIGSSKARGANTGEVDAQTIQKISAKAAAEAKSTNSEAQPTGEDAAAPAAVGSAPSEGTPSASAGGSAPAPPSAAPPPAPAEPAGQGLGHKLQNLLGKFLKGGDATSTSTSSPLPLALPELDAPPLAPGSLHPRVADLVGYVYGEATSALTSTVQVKITAQGIETPLGILTIGQIQKGEAILQELYGLFKGGKGQRDDMRRLSGEFYTVIPHRIGRTRAAAEAAVIDSLEAFEQKQETLQLMKDMLQVNSEGGQVLFKSQAESQYEALRCRVDWVDPATPTFKEVQDYVLKSQVKSRSIRVLNVFTVRREAEWRQFAESLGNLRLMFHGSRIKNWVGILSRGILLPKIVVSLGVNRTDAGWLGNGIYFGDAACTSTFYTSPGKKGTRLMALAQVALGRMKDFHKITYGLNLAPDGYDSTHGVRNTAGHRSEFADDEYVVYTTNQQKLQYLVEFKA